MPASLLDKVVSCPSLPSLPTVAMQVLDLTRNQNVKLAELARVVENDPALCGKILKTVNSSFYGLPKPCPSISRAIGYLGLNTVKSLVLGFSLVDWTSHDKNGLNAVDYWRRCIYSAAAARRIALRTRACEADEAFVAALMQDIGMLAACISLGPDYVSVVTGHDGPHAALATFEQEKLGFDHAQAGAAIATKWRLPQELIDAIRFHHEPENPAQTSGKIVYCVALGTLAAETLAPGSSPEALRRFKRAGKQWFDLRDKDMDGVLQTIAADAATLASLFRLKTGEPPDVNAILAAAEEAAVEHQLAVQREAEQLRETNDALARQAFTDGLTGVGNRKRLDQELTRLFQQAKSTNARLAVVMTDADRFKSVNDTHGHQVGDEVLTELAKRMTHQVGDRGIVCRYGGEEFAIVLPGAGRAEAAKIAEELRSSIAAAPVDVRHMHESIEAVPVTASFGVAVLEPAVAALFVNPQMLVQAADKALYAAKQAGRNCVRVINPIAPPAAGQAA